MSKAKVIVEQRPENPVEKTVLAQAIVDIGKAVRKLSESGLNREAILALVKDSSGIPKSTVSAVLNCLATLQRDYCK